MLLVTYATDTLGSLKKTKPNTPAPTNNYLSQGVIRCMASNHNPTLRGFKAADDET